MKPLNSIKYIRNNARKALPVFISVMVGVMLVYFLSLIVKSTSDFTKETGSNLSERYTTIYSGENTTIPENILRSINSSSNTERVIPLLPGNGGLRLYNVIGATSYNVLNLYEEDVQYFLDSLGLKLNKGKLPKTNKNEILVHERYAAQNKLKLGDSIGSEIDIDYGIKGKYTICGIVKGPVIVAVFCDNKLNMPKDQMVNYSMMFSIKNKNERTIINDITAKAPKDLRIYDYESEKESIRKMISINDVLFLVLSSFITFVLSISLSNLSYISFINRESEFQILSAIGYKKKFLLAKLAKENAVIYLLGYISGLLLCIFISALLNLSLFEPQGKTLPLISGRGVFSALLIPVVVGIVSLMPAAKELRKRETVENIGTTA